MPRRRDTRQKYPLPEWLTEKVKATLDQLLLRHTVEGREKARSLLTLAFPHLKASTIDQLLSQLRSNLEIDALNDKEAVAQREVEEARRQQEAEEKAEMQARLDKRRQDTRAARLELGYTEDEIAKMEESDPSDDGNAELENLFPPNDEGKHE